jgi:hypothetical protein
MRRRPVNAYIRRTLLLITHRHLFLRVSTRAICGASDGDAAAARGRARYEDVLRTAVRNSVPGSRRMSQTCTGSPAHRSRHHRSHAAGSHRRVLRGRCLQVAGTPSGRAVEPRSHQFSFPPDAPAAADAGGVDTSIPPGTSAASGALCSGMQRVQVGGSAAAEASPTPLDRATPARRRDRSPEIGCVGARRVGRKPDGRPRDRVRPRPAARRSGVHSAGPPGRATGRAGRVRGSIGEDEAESRVIRERADEHLGAPVHGGRGERDGGEHGHGRCHPRRERSTVIAPTSARCGRRAPSVADASWRVPETVGSVTATRVRRR